MDEIVCQKQWFIVPVESHADKRGRRGRKMRRSKERIKKNPLETRLRSPYHYTCATKILDNAE
jgi:hypothetical protein